MSVAGVLAEADADLAALRSAVDTAQHIVDTAERSRRTGERLVRRMRTVVVVVAAAGVVLTIVLVVRAARARREVGAGETGRIPPGPPRVGDPVPGSAHPTSDDPPPEETSPTVDGD